MRIEEAKIMVVDDEQELLEIFGAWLGRTGCQVFTALNGAEALRLLQVEKVDALISDIRMPIMDGVSLARHLYTMETEPPSILFVSGYGNISRREIYGMGVEELLDKPLNRETLIQALERCLMNREEKWLTPLPEPMAQRVLLEMESLEEAMASYSFALGRGGCCVTCAIPLQEERTIDLCVRFAKEGLSLEAQGTVVLVDEDKSKAGIAFEYLNPECREWVLGRMKQDRPRSFVPQC